MIEGRRYHFLDGLRGVAMLLGIVLHGAMSFLGIAVWPAVDVKSDPVVFGWLLDVIHGFRMPLFFLVSGFFTAMMWKKRGLGDLVKQRLLRIGVPLFAGTIITLPLMMGLMAWGGKVKGERNAALEGQGLAGAIIEGDLDKVAFLLEEGADPNGVDEGETPMLNLAAVVGRAGMVELLVDKGADLEGKGADGGTAMMSAAFFGRMEVVELLIAKGADVNARNSQGNTVLQAATMDFAIVEMVGEAFSIPIDEGMPERREQCVNLLREAGATEKDSSMDWYWMGVFIPVFHHLWFLYYLLWLLSFFVPLALLWRKLGWRVSDWMIRTPGCLIWLIPLTVWPQMEMHMPQVFGPGTAVGIFPWPAKLGYYAIFFFFGAMCFGKGWWEEKAGTNWWVWFLIAVPFLWFGRQWSREGEVLIGSVCAVVYAWVVIVGMMGLFRRYLNGGHPKWRYLSDSSYWLYLAHMVPIIVLQILLGGWEFPAVLKFLIICFSVTGVLLVIYEHAVRYTWIGAILNGRKFRTPPLPDEDGGDSCVKD